MNWSFNRKPKSLHDQLGLPPYAGTESPNLQLEKLSFGDDQANGFDQIDQITGLPNVNNMMSAQSSPHLALPEKLKDLVSDTESHSIRLQQKPAPLVAILGAKGGVGATTLAVNLATAVAMSGIRTTLIDGDLQKPDICHIIGKEPRHSLTELLLRSTALDKQLFEACKLDVTDAKLGLNLLSPSLDGALSPQTNLSQLAQCLIDLRSYSDFWIIDLPRHLDRHFVTLGDICDKIVLVFEATVAGIAASHRWLNIFNELGYETNKIICVLNRGGSKYSGIERELVNCFGDRPILRIPNASGQIWHSSTRGVPAVLTYANHAYTRAVMNLAGQIKQQLMR